MNVDGLAPRKAAVSQTTSSGSRHSNVYPFEANAFPAPADASEPLLARSELRTTSHGDGAPRKPSQRELSPIHRSLPALLNEYGNLQYHVKELF